MYVLYVHRVKISSTRSQIELGVRVSIFLFASWPAQSENSEEFATIHINAVQIERGGGEGVSVNNPPVFRISLCSGFFSPKFSTIHNLSSGSPINWLEKPQFPVPPFKTRVQSFISTCKWKKKRGFMWDQSPTYTSRPHT